ncbi:hypothetical protein MUY35_15325 [Aliiroseovarius sp. S1339]|uniref:hypothetical protein n=1 Tax=Aliiroseovarius sp. S1339 TaxID=2936990 RepID=UPI0020C06859|nr:hypothetical protein [Aliiroseovarius sp. S1339]MCK8465229.1 hypothetical protein [Aliiroseovarius sp. S1339]
MRIILATSLACVLLAGCTGHKYEPREPGLTYSGEAGAGVVYEDGKVRPHTETKLTIGIGGSI